MNKLFTLLVSWFIIQGVIAQTWQPLGTPFPLNRMGQINGIERTTQIKFHPTDPKTLYAVTAMGGLFISQDEGANWRKTGTDNMPFSRMASVCIDYTNPRIMYLGTGDPNYYSSNESVGIYKSTNGGETWSQSTTGLGNTLAVEILMSPTSSSTLIAATSNGIYKSINSGGNWTQKRAGQFTDLVMKPGAGSTTLYAATFDQFFVSTNMGDSWTTITLPSTTGVKNGGRIGVSPANPTTVYLTFAGEYNNDINNGPIIKNCTPLFKSTNSGSSFSTVKAAGVPNFNGYDPDADGQENYNYDIVVDPLDANKLCIVGHVVWKLTNGGTSWSQITSWANRVHTDMHHIVYSPFNSSKLYNVNDGGIWLSTDGGVEWVQKSDGLAGAEIYHAAASPIKKAVLDIGTQDNGELMYDGNNSNNWVTIGGGDYDAKLVFGYLNSTEVYSLNNNGYRKTLADGSWSTLNFPFFSNDGFGRDGHGNDICMEFSPITGQSGLAFISQNDIYRTTSLGTNPPTWSQISFFNTPIKALASSPANANVLYVVTSDNKIRRTDNALAASPTFNTYTTPGMTNVMASIAVIKNNPSIVYLSCGNSVYKSTNSGQTWGAAITPALPNVNIFKIFHDNYSTNESIYVGTAKSVYYRNNTMSSWVNYSAGLPTVSDMTDFLMFNDGTNNSELYVSFKGRGVWRNNLYGRQVTLRDPENPSVSVSGSVSYKYYEGTWSFLPNFNNLNPIKTGTVTTFSTTPKNRNNQIGFSYTGFVNVPTDGEYTFYLSSLDGSQLFIGNDLIVNNDGSGSSSEKSGKIGLKSGKHVIKINYFNNASTSSLTVSYSGTSLTKQTIPSSALFRLPDPIACTGTGTITREYWSGIQGDLIAYIPLSSAPNSTTAKTSIEEIVNQADDYGVRYRGYICAPYTGNYTFYVASDDESEFWLSPTTSPSGKIKRAYVSGAVTGQRDWYRYAFQKSAPISLTAGQKYYIEALYKEGGGDDNFAVAWKLPSGEFEGPISGSRLSPYSGGTPSLLPDDSVDTYRNDSLITSVYNPNTGGNIYFKDSLKNELLNKGQILASNYPNPFEEKTILKLKMSKRDQVSIKLITTTGANVIDIFAGLLEQGEHEVVVDGSNLASGTYLCQIQSSSGSSTLRLAKIEKPKKQF